MPDLSKLSDSDFDALESGNLSGISDEGLSLLEEQYGGMRDAPADEDGGFISGLKTGLRREDLPEGSDFSSRAGRFIGRYGTQTAGAVGLGLATGGAGLIPAAAAAGLGAAGGEAYSQIGSRLLDGESPGTSGEAAGEIAKTGLVTALTDIGVGGGMRIAGMAFPKIAEAFVRVPSEAIKRAISRYRANPSIVPFRGRGAASSVERGGAGALRKVQVAMETERKAAGESVDVALEAMENAVQSRPVVDLTMVAEAGKNVLAESGADDAAVKAALGPEFKKIQQIIKAIDSNPLKSPRQAVNIRRAIDSLQDFTRGGAVPVSSQPGRRALTAMAKANREAINEAADAVGFNALKQANDEFHSIATAMDDYEPFFATKDTSIGSLLKKFEVVSREFYKGGLRGELLQSAKQAFPTAAKSIDELLDFSAAKAFTSPMVPSPSSAMLNAIRVMSHPAFLRSALASQDAVRATAIGAAASSQ